MSMQINMQASLRPHRLLNTGQLAPEIICIVKRSNVGKVLDMLGGNGIAPEYHVMRHIVNLGTVNTYEGTRDIYALIVGRGITGLPTF